MPGFQMASEARTVASHWAGTTYSAVTSVSPEEHYWYEGKDGSHVHNCRTPEEGRGSNGT